MLIIDTSTERGILALVHQDSGSTPPTIVYQKELLGEKKDSVEIFNCLRMLFESDILNAANVDFIAVGIGPGAYTGIRIGVSIAMALSSVWTKPIVPFSSLHAFAPAFENSLNFAVMIDAKMSGVFFISARMENEQIVYLNEPTLMPVNQQLCQMVADLNISLVFTPSVLTLEKKFLNYFPSWKWCESEVNLIHLSQIIQKRYQNLDWLDSKDLELLYLKNDYSACGVC